jgi:hypothetical protein
VYEVERMRGVNDLGEILMLMGFSFEKFDMQDAFIGPWDVANKVGLFSYMFHCI